MLRISATVAVTFLLLVAARGRSPDNMVAGPPEASLLCASKCGTCPVVCSPPSPPKSPGGVTLSPPTKKTPPSPSASSSYPYYYFYTAGADRSHGLVFGFLWLLPLLVLSFVAGSKCSQHRDALSTRNRMPSL